MTLSLVFNVNNCNSTLNKLNAQPNLNSVRRIKNVEFVTTRVNLSYQYADALVQLGMSMKHASSTGLLKSWRLLRLCRSPSVRSAMRNLAPTWRLAVKSYPLIYYLTRSKTWSQEMLRWWSSILLWFCSQLLPFY